MRTDGRTDMMKLTVAFRNSTNAPKTSIHEEIQRRLKSGYVRHHSSQILLFPSSLSKNMKVKICRTVIVPVVSYWCDVWPLALRENLRLRVFGNSVLREISVLRRTW